jgi:transcriptional regulator GlxA family with amidase domain
LENPATTGIGFRAFIVHGVFGLLSRLESRHLPKPALNEQNRRFLSCQLALLRNCDLKPRTPASSQTGNVTIDRAVQLFQQNLEERLSLDEIAKSVDISLRQFERHFGFATGSTPKAQYIAKRIEYARTMVQATPLSVHDVALATRFSSYATLSR